MEYKTYSDKYLMSLTKAQIIELLRTAEHNFFATEEVLNNSAKAGMEITEKYDKAKELLKQAVEDIHELLCDRGNLDGIGQSCNVCSYIDNCPCCNRCDIIPELRTWRYADEALKLIGG